MEIAAQQKELHVHATWRSRHWPPKKRQSKNRQSQAIILEETSQVTGYWKMETRERRGSINAARNRCNIM